MKKITINIAKDYTKTPGPRFISDGPFSGQDFREKFLEKYFVLDHLLNINLEIILDGVTGYPTSFLEEAFGGLARKYGIETCLSRINFISVENQRRIDEIFKYIKESKNS